MAFITFLLCLASIVHLPSAYKLHNGRVPGHKQFFGMSSRLYSANLGKVLSLDEVKLKDDKGQALSMGMPKVIAPSSADEDWLLWYHSRDSELSSELIKMSSGRVYFATSKDGLTNWVHDEDSPVMGPNKDDGNWFTYDSEHVGMGDIIQPGRRATSKFADQGDVFLMYTFGGNADSVTIDEGTATAKKVVGTKLEIGVCVSRDGAHWSRIEGPSAYGAIVEVGSPDSAPLDFDALYVGWPSVIECGTNYYMYYNTYDARTKKWVIALAIAPDGLMKWNKMGPVFAGGGDEAESDLGHNFDALGASRRHVVRMPDDTFRMYYEGVPSGDLGTGIGLAVSKDGIRWEKAACGPVFEASSDTDAWDSGSVGSPHLVWMPEKKRWRMYYIGSAAKGQADTGLPTSNLDPLSAIGVAESTAEDGLQFVRVSI